jgi:hypothetical protein
MRQLVMLSLDAFLALCTLYQARKVNFRIRFFHVWVNELVYTGGIKMMEAAEEESTLVQSLQAVKFKIQ